MISIHWKFVQKFHFGLSGETHLAQ